MLRKQFKRQRLIILLLALAAFNLNAQNLLLNADAESGDTQGWVDADNAWDAANDITPHGGNYCFWPTRLNIPYTEIYQDIDVTAYGPSIDVGSAWFILSGWLANWNQYPHDRATLAIEAFDENYGQQLYLSRDHRSPVWTEYQLEAQIPPATRILRVHLIATRFVGSDNDGYFDDLSLRINDLAPMVSVTVSAENNLSQLPLDGTLQLDAETSGGSDTGYYWSSSFEAIATVDSNGLATAHRAGKFTILATGKNTSKTGYIELTAFRPDDIIFVAPKYEAEWLRGSAQEVSWEVKGSVSSGTIYYSLTGGSEWTEIASIDSVAKGHFIWIVPHTDEVLNDCYLKLDWGGEEAVSSKFSIIPEVTSIRESGSANLPDYCRLYPNFPNPFNPLTNIQYRIGSQDHSSRHVRLTVYDSRGKLVNTLVNEEQAPGEYLVNFDAGGLASGVYIFHLSTSSGYSESRKMILMR